MPSKQTTLGSRIVQARSKLGISAAQLAARVGVKASTVEKWERDRGAPRSNKLLTLAGILNLPVAWLIGGEDSDAPSAAPRRSDETATIAHKLERALALQQGLAALLHEVSADVTRLQRDLDGGSDLAA